MLGAVATGTVRVPAIAKGPLQPPERKSYMKEAPLGAAGVPSGVAEALHTGVGAVPRGEVFASGSEVWAPMGAVEGAWLPGWPWPQRVLWPSCRFFDIQRRSGP